MNNLIPKKYKFANLVEGITGFKVTPYSWQDEDQRTTIEFLQHILNAIVLSPIFNEEKTFSSAGIITKLNEAIVEKFTYEINKTKSPIGHTYVAKTLERMSYGDILVTHMKTDHTFEKYYLELILSANWFNNSSDGLRYFYMSELKNICDTATHLLIIFPFEREKNYFLKPIILDPSNMELNMKIEYNSSLKNIKALKPL